MALALSLPQIDERPSNPPETRLARVGPWLDDLLKRDPTEAARVIGDALAATNRVSLSESRRLELSEKYHTTAQALWPNLERQFSRAPHPLSGKALEAAKASLTLAAELSTSYKHLLAHEAGKRILLTGNRLLVALIHRCLQCTARVLINSYLSYSPVPARTWHDAHLIYKFAFDRGLHQTPVATDNPDATPERLYMQALLLALANPYGFLPGQLAQVATRAAISTAARCFCSPSIWRFKFRNNCVYSMRAARRLPTSAPTLAPRCNTPRSCGACCGSGRFRRRGNSTACPRERAS